jgi:hypothetical protein
MNKPWSILPTAKDNLYRVRSPFVIIVFLEALADSMSLEADNGIALRIKVRAPAQGVDGDLVLRDGFGGIAKVALADEAQQPGRI